MSSRHLLPTSASLFALLIVVGLLQWPTHAATLADPYANAVDGLTGGAVLNGANALGAPNGTFATVVGVLGSNLVLDLGNGEEGTGDLRVTYRGLLVGVATQVEFLDANHQRIASSPLNLTGLGLGSSYTATAAYPTAPAPYRYVRLTAVASQYEIDAVEARTYRPDSDGDGLPDEWELRSGLNPLDATGNHGANGDPDGDGLTNAREYGLGTNPTQADTDSDGLNDGYEVNTSATDPKQADTDSDGLSDGQEIILGTNPKQADTDSDGLSDGQEIILGTNPKQADTDGDGLRDGQEVTLGTNPNMVDTDGDGLPDGWEVGYGLNPLDPTGAHGATGDPDGDGRLNRDEYRAGTNPVVADPSATATVSPTSTAIATASPTSTVAPTTTITPIHTATGTPLATSTASATATSAPTSTASATVSPTRTATTTATTVPSPIGTTPPASPTTTAAPTASAIPTTTLPRERATLFVPMVMK